MKLYLAENDHIEWAGTVCTFRDINTKPSSQFICDPSSTLDSGGGLTRIRWHLLMIDSVLSCHFQLPLFLFLGCFSFVPSVTAMLLGTLVIQSLSISSLRFVQLHLSSMVLPLYPSLVPAPCLVLALLLLFFSPSICDSVITSDFWWGGGETEAFFSTERCSRGGFSLWKASNLNADGKSFNSTMCSIPNKALFFSCYAHLVLYKLLPLTNREKSERRGGEKKTNAKIPKQICFGLIKALQLCLVVVLFETYGPCYSLIQWAATATSYGLFMSLW